MRTLVAALLLAVSAPAFADKPAPPYLGVTPGQELELPHTTEPFNITFLVVRHEQSDDDQKSSCTLTQGSHHVEGTGDTMCELTIDPKAGFAAGPATYSGRTSVSGVWSEPSSVELTLVAPGNLWAQTGASQGAIELTHTRSATLAHGKLSFTLFTQGGNDFFMPMYPYLGRVSVAVAANGKIDAVVPIDDHWIAPLAKSNGWAHNFSDGNALLTAKAVHVTGTYNAREGVDLTVQVQGSDRGVAEISFRPAGYKVKAGFIDCDKLSAEQRRMHSVCN